MGLTLDEVSSRVDFSKPYLSTIETGKVKNPPSEALLSKLEETLNFNRGELVKLAQLERLPEDIRNDLELSYTQNQKLKKVLRDFIKSNGNHKGVSTVLQELDQVLEFDLNPNNSAGIIPVINRVSAGYPCDFNDLDYPAGVADDYVRCPDIRDHNAFAVRVVGDSMQPNYTEGDIVVFSPALDVRNGDDCFVRFMEPHETTFKRVFFEKDEMVRLQPRNEKYSPMIIPGERVSGIYRAAVRYQII